jgi:hypothetical protein
MTTCRSFLRRTTTRAGWERSRTRVTSCGLPRRADAHVADFDRINKPENDDPSIVEPIEPAAPDAA